MRIIQLLAACVLALGACSSPGPQNGPVPGHEEAGRSSEGLMLATEDGHVFVRRTGAGPDLVLLHGLADSSTTWHRVEAPLREAGYRVTVWDALGSGLSEKPMDADLGLEAHAARLQQVMDRLGIRSAVLVGNSLGGSLALLMAERHPERVRGLVLLDPAVYADELLATRWYWRFQSMIGFFAKRLEPRTFAVIALRWIYADPDRIGEELIARYAAEAARFGALDSAFEQQRAVLNADPAETRRFEEGLAAIACPALVLWGDGDAVIPLHQGEQLQRQLPNASLQVLRGIGHAPQLEAPEAVVAAVVGFLGELPAEPGRR